MDLEQIFLAFIGLFILFVLVPMGIKWYRDTEYYERRETLQSIFSMVAVTLLILFLGVVFFTGFLGQTD